MSAERAVIGDTQTFISFAPQSFDPKCDAWESAGAFSVHGLRGEFHCFLQPEPFVSKLEQMHRTLSGSAALDDHEHALDLILACGDRGLVTVTATVTNGQAYKASFAFEIDQTYLRPTINSFRSAFTVTQ